MIPASGIALIFVLIHFLKGRIDRLTLYLPFALAVIISVQLVGVYLVFARLIEPGLPVRDCTEQRRVLFSYVVGIGGYASGLALSMAFDLPSGALIV